MPGLLIPHKSGVHRVACFALYRSLLRQKSILPISELQKQQYEAQIKSKTRENSHLQGHQDIALALRLGYEILEAVKDDTRRGIILDRIAQLSKPVPRSFVKERKKPQPEPPKPNVAPRAPASKTASKQQSRSYPSRSPVLERPYLQISGRRHVPTLVDANRFPFLRIKKPQSPLIGALIRRAARLREKRQLQRVRFEKEIRLGKEEDEWDRLLGLEFGLSEPRQSWKDESAEVLRETKKRHDAAVERKISIAREMTIIVEKEKALALHEKMEKKNQKPSGRRRLRTADGGNGVSTAFHQQPGAKNFDPRPPLTKDVLQKDSQISTAVQHGSAQEGLHQSTADKIKTIANITSIWDSKSTRQSKRGQLQQRGERRQSSTLSRAQLFQILWRREWCYAAIDSRSVVRGGIQIRQFSTPRKAQENRAFKEDAASGRIEIKPSPRRSGDNKASWDLIRQSKDDNVTPKPNQKRAAMREPKLVSLPIRRLQSKISEGQAYWHSQTTRHAAENPSINRTHKLIELVERHHHGEAVTVRKHLVRDESPKKPHDTKKPIESNGNDVDAADSVARNRVGAPILRKVSVKGFRKVAIADDKAQRGS